MHLAANWIATMDAAIKNPKSALYDAIIKRTVAHYQLRFGKTPGFPALDWRLFKAQLLVESGGPTNPAWSTRPMQIGNPGDAAYGVLRSGVQGSNLIMSVPLKMDISSKSISTPELNIRAAIAYVFTLAAKFHPAQVIDNPKVKHVKVMPGQSLSSIAAAQHTTIQDLVQENPKAAGVLHPGQVLKFQAAHMAIVIAGWKQITPEFLARWYNGGGYDGFGDPAYAAKLKYVLGKLGS